MRFLGACLGAVVISASSFSGCSSDDPVTGRQPRCGNGYLEEEELCDSMEIYCSDDCMSEIGRCGDGIVQEEFGEKCDPFVLGGGGAGGAGGGGGASPVAESVPGCSAQCQPQLGFLCEPSENSCGQTGVDPDALVEDHLEEVCAYFIGLWGGTGSTFACAVGGQAEEYTAGEVEDCVADLSVEQGCKIAEIETWAEGKTRCEIAVGTTPCLE